MREVCVCPRGGISLSPLPISRIQARDAREIQESLWAAHGHRFQSSRHKLGIMHIRSIDYVGQRQAMPLTQHTALCDSFTAFGRISSDRIAAERRLWSKLHPICSDVPLFSCPSASESAAALVLNGLRTLSKSAFDARLIHTFFVSSILSHF